MDYFRLFASSFLLISCLSSTAFAQQFQPEDILHTQGQHQLKYKHFLAYANIELAGEDPALLNNQQYMQELVTECIEEFNEAPTEFVQDLDQHYQAMQKGAGFQMGQAASRPEPSSVGESFKREPSHSEKPQFNAGNSQWKQTLSGSALFTTTTQSGGDLFVQNTQIMHLCPDGLAYNYSVTGGGGTYSGIDISDPRQMNFEGSFNWNVIEQGGGTYFQFTIQGVSRAVPISVVNGKIVIQGLGNFSLQQYGARCR